MRENWSEWFDRQGPGHFDLCLRRVLTELSAGILPASYIFPAVGGFDEHVSAFQNTKAEEARECPWELYKAIQEGTRQNDSQDRAVSRSIPWQQWQLKVFPRELNYRWENEEVAVQQIPDRPLDSPDIWWTAAATIGDEFYQKQPPGKRAADVRKRAKIDDSSKPKKSGRAAQLCR